MAFFRCIICLFSLREEDEIIKTECLHFFHKQCLGRYITNMQVSNHKSHPLIKILCLKVVDVAPLMALSIQETYQEQKEELLAQNSNVTVNKFQLTCPVCREPIGATHPKHC